MEYNAPRAGSAPAFLDAGDAAGTESAAAYGQMFGSAYSGVFPPAGVGDAAGAAPGDPRQNLSAFEAGYLAAAGALGEGMPPTSNPSGDWGQQQ